jgi:hypothetical protein
MLGLVLAVVLGLVGSEGAQADGGTPRLGFPSPPRFEAQADARNSTVFSSRPGGGGLDLVAIA